jgi:CDP-4-dehydro-6-deoxyglucose reductase, E3
LENTSTQRLFTHIKEHGFVNVRLPFGACCIECLDPKRPIIFIAGGTGFAPVKAMIEQLLSGSDARAFELFWGARIHSDLYMDEKVSSWQAHVSRFRYFSLISDENTKPIVSFVLDRHSDDLGEWQIVISGPFDMVYSSRDELVSHGVSPEHLFSDAFSFETK